LRQSEKLAAAIVGAPGESRDLDRDLRDWWRWRDDDAWEMYWFAHDMGAAGPTPPWRRAAQRRIDADPRATAAMVRVLNHELLPSQLFTPGFFLATSAHALRQGRGRRRAIGREMLATVATDLRRGAARGKARQPAWTSGY
jgi:hypothetical protein